MLCSLRIQLSLSILLILLMMVTLISTTSSWFINREFEEYMIRQENERSMSTVNDLGNQYNDLTDGWNQGFLHTIGMYSLYDDYPLKIYGTRETLLWDAENRDMPLHGQIVGEISDRVKDAKKSRTFVTHTYPINRDGKQAGSVSITYYRSYFSTENDYRFIEALNGILLVVGLLSATFAVVTGTLLARRITRPISKTACIVTQISERNYRVRFENTPDTHELEEMVIATSHLAQVLSEQESLRKRLTSDAVHELRTPLSAVSSHLGTMVEGTWETTLERLQSYQEEIKRLGGLVADLQRSANTEDGNLKLSKTRVGLHEIAQTVVRNLESEGMRKQISLSVNGNPAYVGADREKVIQITMNLLLNTLHYTPQSEQIEVETLETEAESILRVKDNEIGIPEQELPCVFERFYRTDKSWNRKTGETGIGLVIAKSIVRLHGGKITVENTVGEGNSFTALLPKRT